MAAVIDNRNISLGVLGGTLITAACYSGGDVFGCSPYDAATTAYLKATYPSYWAQIRDYGFANPQLVPFINEDNDLIVSLVEVGKERWLKTINGARIITNIYTPNNSNWVRFKAQFLTYSGGGYANMFGNPGSNSHAIRLLLNNGNSKGFRLYHQAVDGAEGMLNTSATDIIEGELKNGRYFVNNQEGNARDRQSSPSTANFSMFDMLGRAHQRICYLIINNGDLMIANFVPCKNPNGSDYGMLDLVNLQWYGNANTSGAFTIEMTDTL